MAYQRQHHSCDEYWQPEAMMFHPVGKSAAALDGGNRDKLRNVMRAALPAAADDDPSCNVGAVAFRARS
jgi:hypothetical protein